MEITLSVLFWGYVMAFCVHVIEEAAVGEGFLGMMRKTFYLKASWGMFFGFNFMILLVLVASIVVFELFGGIWVIWPLSLAFTFVTNGIWHFLQTIVLREYSPGLISSPIYWILMYFITRYFLLMGELLLLYYVISLVIGTVVTLVMFVLAYHVRRKGKE